VAGGAVRWTLGSDVRAVWPWLAAALLVLLAVDAEAQAPLFSFVQFSDVQANDPIERARFDLVLDAIEEAGQPGALLPGAVSFVVIAGDLVNDPGDNSEWTQLRNQLDDELTGNGIPWLAVPGNHDQDEFGPVEYEALIADVGVWDTSSAEVRGHGGLVAATGWAGLRLIGVNSSHLAWNQVATADAAQVHAIAASAAAAGENVLIVSHHPHDEFGPIPLAETLEIPGVIGYLRGHKGTPHATLGLAGVANPVWDLSSESVMRDAALIYYQVFAAEIRAYVLKLVEAPAALPAPSVIALAHPLAPAPPAAPPLAAFTAEPTTGAAPLEVAFADLSAGLPTAWLWAFGDGASSTERHPVHAYAVEGSYDVTLTATNASGSDAHTMPAAVEVAPEPPSVSFGAVADARVSEDSPDANFGSSSTLRVRSAPGDSFESYLRFAVTGLGGQQVASAVLRLYVTDPSDSGGEVAAAGPGWDEATITWANAPGAVGAPLDALDTVLPDGWVAFDVSALVEHEGVYDFRIASPSSNTVRYASREGDPPPLLVVYTAPVLPSLGAGGALALAALVGGLGLSALARRTPRP
jgi:PKD repeat protein